MARGCGKIVHYWQEWENGRAAMKNSRLVPQKVKHRITHDPAFPRLHTYWKELYSDVHTHATQHVCHNFEGVMLRIGKY